MIFAYDQGAWHPNSIVMNLWLVSALVLILLQFVVTKNRLSGLAAYSAFVSPMVTTAMLLAYFYIGRRGEHGAHFDFNWVLACTILFFPVLIGLSIAKWEWLRTRVAWLFWSIFALALTLQGFIDFLLWVVSDS